MSTMISQHSPNSLQEEQLKKWNKTRSPQRRNTASKNWWCVLKGRKADFNSSLVLSLVYMPSQRLQSVVVTHQIQERSNKRPGGALWTASREEPADGQKYNGDRQKLICRNQWTTHPDRAKEGEILLYALCTELKLFQNCASIEYA